MGGRGAFSMSAWANGGIGAGGSSLDVTDRYRGMSLQQAEDAIRGIRDHEEAVVFDKNMNVIAAYSGGSGSVQLPESLKRKDGITITHNHPPGSADYGATFSPADISWFASSRAREIRAVGQGQGEHVYSVQVRGKQSSTSVKYAKTQLRLWAASVRADTIPKSQGGTGKLQSEWRKAYDAHRRKGASKAAADHAAWQQATGALDRSLTDFVASTGNGAIYYARNKRYRVNR